MAATTAPKIVVKRATDKFTAFSRFTATYADGTTLTGRVHVVRTGLRYRSDVWYASVDGNTKAEAFTRTEAIALALNFAQAV